MMIEDALQLTRSVKGLAMHETLAMHDTPVKLHRSAACGMVCVLSFVFMAMQHMAD